MGGISKVTRGVRGDAGHEPSSSPGGEAAALGPKPASATWGTGEPGNRGTDRGRMVVEDTGLWAPAEE